MCMYVCMYVMLQHVLSVHGSVLCTESKVRTRMRYCYQHVVHTLFHVCWLIVMDTRLAI